MSRVISQLLWAKWVNHQPPASVAARARNQRGVSIRAGLAYQRKVGKALHPLGAVLREGPWISFFDRNGPGLAQPDLLILSPAGPVLIEVKLTYTDLAIPQLDFLYVPLVAHLAEVSPRQVRRAILCKHLTASAVEPKPASECCLADATPLGIPPLTMFWSGDSPLNFGVL